MMVKKIAALLLMFIGLVVIAYGINNGRYFTSPVADSPVTDSPVLKVNAAYKYPNNPAVYVWDGKVFHWIVNEQAFFRYYGCRNKRQLTDCAPIYDMPSSVSLVTGEPIR